MIREYKRLTHTELKSVIEYYQSHFPSWRIVNRSNLVRERAPVLQGVTFERLSCGEYRPTAHIRVLCARAEHWYFELPQNLNVKLREIDRRRDKTLRELVFEAMRREFVPSMDQPLSSPEVLELYERKAAPSDSQAFSLAAFNAYLGHDERAMYWCAQFPKLIDQLGIEWQEIDHKRRSFLRDLETWIRNGEAKQQLERVLQEERRKWGLV